MNGTKWLKVTQQDANQGKCPIQCQVFTLQLWVVCRSLICPCEQCEECCVSERVFCLFCKPGVGENLIDITQQCERLEVPALEGRITCETYGMS